LLQLGCKHLWSKQTSPMLRPGFPIIANGGVSTRLLLEALASGKRKRATAADFRDETP
jgi:uncharacterized protein (DUF433 family)